MDIKERILDGMDSAIEKLIQRVEMLEQEKEIKASRIPDAVHDSQPSKKQKGLTVKQKEIIKQFMIDGLNMPTGTKSGYLDNYEKSLSTEPATGGSTIQEVVERELIEQAIENQVLLSEMGQRGVPDGSPYSIPVLLTRPNIQATVENVNGTIVNPTENPTFGSTSAVYTKAFAMPALTHEIIQDSVIDVVAETQRMINQELSFHFINQILFGVYSADPQQLRGLLTDRIDSSNNYAGAEMPDDTRSKELFQVFKTGVNGSLPNASQEALIDFLIDVSTSLSHEYQDNAKWYMNKETYAVLRKLKASEDGSDIRGLLDGAFGTLNGTFMLMGKPVVIVDQMPTLDGTTVVAPIMYGDLKQAAEFITIGNSMNSIIDQYTIKGQNLYYTDIRFGEIIRNYDALRVIVASV